MDTIKALQAWYDYGVLLHEASRQGVLDDEWLEEGIRVHKMILGLIEDSYRIQHRAEEEEALYEEQVRKRHMMRSREYRARKKEEATRNISWYDQVFS